MSLLGVFGVSDYESVGRLLFFLELSDGSVNSYFEKNSCRFWEGGFRGR